MTRFRCMLSPPMFADPTAAPAFWRVMLGVVLRPSAAPAWSRALAGPATSAIPLRQAAGIPFA